MAKKKIDDFGEQIYGAKKHLAELGRFLRSEDITEWNAQEREQLINKNQIWKKPDYQQMYDDGMPKEVVYFIKKIRDSLPAKPAKATEEYQKGYIDFVGYFRDKVLEMQTTAEIERFHQDVVLTSPYVKDEGMYHYPRYSTTPEAYGCMSNKFFKAAQSSLLSIKYEIKKKEFLYSEDEKLLKGCNFFKYNGENASVDENHTGRDGNPAIAVSQGYSKYYLYQQPEEFRNPEKWKPDTYVAINKSNKIIGVDFPTLEEAKRAALEQERENQKENPAPEQTRKKGKQKLTPPQLSHIERTGYDYRENADTVESNYLQELGFRGVQFGNWENQNDRQTNMNMAYDAMKDLAKALNISDSDASLGNQLALAFGARGSGNAVAHYEPLENVINITKLKGAGSLAHEWGHALDSFIQSSISNEAEIQAEAQSRFGTYGTEIVSRRTESMLQQSKSCFFATEDKYSIMKSVVDAMKYKTDSEGRTVKTDFLTNAQELDGEYSTSGNQKGSTEKGYWSSDVELFARAFACYVHDKLAEHGMRNDYLCGHSEAGKCSPHGEEREVINREIDKVFVQLRERGLMHENTEQSRTQEYIRTDFAVETKKPETEQPAQEQLPVHENTEEHHEYTATDEKHEAFIEAVKKEIDNQSETISKEIDKIFREDTEKKEHHEYAVGDVVLMPSEIMLDSRMKPVFMPPEYALITDMSDERVDIKTFKDSSLQDFSGLGSQDRNSFLTKAPEYIGRYEELVRKEPAVEIQSVQITETTSDLLKQINPDASPALVNAVIKELDRRIDAEKENVSKEDVEDLFHYAKFQIAYSVDGTEHSYESSQCEIGGYERISLTEQVKFDVQYENGRLQRQPDSDKEQELKTIQKFLIPALEQSEELNESDRKTLDSLFAEYDRQQEQQKDTIIGNINLEEISKKTHVNIKITGREIAERIAEYLLESNDIPFSCKFSNQIDDFTGFPVPDVMFTVNKKDVREMECISAFLGKRYGDLIIATQNFRDIPDKAYICYKKEISESLAEVLTATDKTIPFAALFNDRISYIAVSRQNEEIMKKLLAVSEKYRDTHSGNFRTVSYRNGLAQTVQPLIQEYYQKNTPSPEPEKKHSVLENAQKAKNGSLIVENTQYRFIPKKTYVSTDRETAEKVAEKLLADGTIKFSSAFRPNADNVTFTVSEQDKESLKQMIEKYRQNEKSTPDMPAPDNTAEHQNVQKNESSQDKKYNQRTEAEKAMEIITNAVQSGAMTEEQDKALAFVQKLIEQQINSAVEHQQETGNIQNSSETPVKQSQNTHKTAEKQLSFFDAVPEQEYELKKPEQEVQLSFLDYIAARQTELDTYRFAAEICLDATYENMASDNPELYEKLSELLTKKFDENLHSSEPVITEQDLQECIEQNQVNTWLADFVNEVIEENMPKQNQQRKQQVQHNF